MLLFSSFQCRVLGSMRKTWYRLLENWRCSAYDSVMYSLARSEGFMRPGVIRRETIT